MLQQKAGMNQPLEKKGPTERGVNEQQTQPEEAGFSSVSHSGKYHSLIQDQARELTHLRQQMKIGRAVSSHLIQHVKNTVKTFEELLSSNKIDHYMEQHFRKQLAKGSQLAESLASKFSTDDCISKKNQSEQTLRTLCILREMHKMDKVMDVQEPKQDAQPQTQTQIHSSSHAQTAVHCSPSNTSSLLGEQEVRPAVNVADVSSAAPADSASLPSNYSEARCAQLFYPLNDTTQLSGTPDRGHQGSSGSWDAMRPQKMNASGNLSSSSLYRPNSKPSGTHSGQENKGSQGHLEAPYRERADLLEKNLVEIHNLRQRLEESVCINDRLQERLEHVLSNADQGKSTAQSAPDVSLATPHSYTQSHSSGSGQNIL